MGRCHLLDRNYIPQIEDINEEVNFNIDDDFESNVEECLESLNDTIAANLTVTSTTSQVYYTEDELNDLDNTYYEDVIEWSSFDE